MTDIKVFSHREIMLEKERDVLTEQLDISRSATSDLRRSVDHLTSRVRTLQKQGLNLRGQLSGAEAFVLGKKNAEYAAFGKTSPVRPPVDPVVYADPGRAGEAMQEYMRTAGGEPPKYRPALVSELLTKNTALDKRNGTLVQEIADVHKDADKLADETTDLENEIYSLKNTAEEQQAKVERLVDERDNLEKEKGSIMARLAVVPNTGAKFERLQLQYDNLIRSKDNWKRRALKQDGKLARVHEIVVKGLRDRNDRLLVEIAGLDREKDALKTARAVSIDGMHKANKRQYDIITKQDVDLRVATADYDKAINRNVELMQANTTFRHKEDQVKGMTVTITKQAENIRNLKQLVVRLQDEINEWKDNVVDKRATVASMKKEIVALHDTNRDDREGYAPLRAEVTDLKDKNARQYLTIEKYMRENKVLRDHKDTQHKVLLKLNKEELRLKERNLRQYVKLGALTARVGNRDRTIKNLNTAIERHLATVERQAVMLRDNVGRPMNVTNVTKTISVPDAQSLGDFKKQLANKDDEIYILHERLGDADHLKPAPSNPSLTDIYRGRSKLKDDENIKLRQYQRVQIQTLVSQRKELHAAATWRADARKRLISLQRQLKEATDAHGELEARVGISYVPKNPFNMEARYPIDTSEKKTSAISDLIKGDDDDAA